MFCNDCVLMIRYRLDMHSQEEAVYIRQVELYV